MTQGDNDPGIYVWAMWCHLSSLAWLPLLLLGFVGIALPIPLLNILGPLVVWLSKRNQHSLIDAHGKESLNFQISFTIYSVIALIVLIFLIAVTCGVGLSNSSVTSEVLNQIGLWIGITSIGFGLLLSLFKFILVIFAAIKAKKGEFYHYPFTIRFLR